MADFVRCGSRGGAEAFEFAPAPDGSAVLPARVRAKVQGRAMLVVGIDEEQTVEFSDYQRVID